MNRIDFSKALTVAREQSGLGKNEFCRRCGFNFNQLQRLETAYNNFKAELIFQYLSTIGYCVYIKGQGKQATKICNYNDLVKWLKDQRQSTNWTILAISELTGFSHTSVSNLFNDKQTITVDFLLAMCEALKCDIQIKPK